VRGSLTAVNEEGNMKRRPAVVLAIAFAIVGFAAVPIALATPTQSELARLVRVTSPISRGSYATLVARVVPSRTCSIVVYYKSGPSTAQGLYPKRPRSGRVSWT
jgi:hypothetical protein